MYIFIYIYIYIYKNIYDMNNAKKANQDTI